MGRERAQRHQKKCRRESTDETAELSPPSYCVQEKDGKLVNPALNVTWPERPSAGRYSKQFQQQLAKERKKRKEAQEELQVDAMTETKDRLEFSNVVKSKRARELVSLKELQDAKSPASPGADVTSSDVRSILSRRSVSNQTNSGERGFMESSLNHFIGIQKPERVCNFLRPTHFVLYYSRRDVYKVSDIPLELPLMLAYMSNKLHIYHYPMLREQRNDGTKIWQVQLNATELSATQPCFLTLSGLVSFYESFVNMTHNGDVEIMPVSDSE